MIAATRQRILRATAGTLSWQPQDADGEPADPGVVTLGVVASDGTEVLAAGTAAAAAGSGTSPRTLTLTVAQTAQLDVLTATWKVGSTVVAVTKHDIVGGYYFTIAELRDVETSTSNVSENAKAEVNRARAETEAMFESACAMAFVPRFDVERHRVNGCQLVLDRPYVRSVRWVRFWSSTTDYTALSPVECAAIAPTDTGVLTMAYTAWGEVEVGYEHGLDAPPFDVRRESLVAARAQLNKAGTSTALDRATSMQLGDGTSVTLATPGVGRWHTGIPSVDEVLRRYDHTTPGIG